MGLGNFQQVIYDSTGRRKPSHYIYAAFGERDDLIVCKVGFSSAPTLKNRLYMIASHGSVRITFAKVLSANGLANARSMEKMMHTILGPVADHHEWFQFDPHNLEHKQLFKSGWSTVARAFGSEELTIDIDELRAQGIEKARASMLRVREKKGKMSERWRNLPPRKT